MSQVFYQRVAKADLIDVWLFIAGDNVIYNELHEKGITVLRVWHAARDPAGLRL